MSTLTDTTANSRRLWIAVSLVGVVSIIFRLVSLAALPLIDPSEGRYSVVAKLMGESGNLLIPYVIRADGSLVPFWGKPPLFFWMVTACNALFGVNEFSARLPSFLASLVTIGAAALFAYKQFGRRAAALTTISVSTTGMFFLYAGLCQIDMLLTACYTASMIGFYFSIFTEYPRRRYGWATVFFAALGLGMITKGPVVIALAVISIGLWLTWSRKWRMLRRLPIVYGSIIFFAICAPWYLAVEAQTPGFLRYFFINENLLRYLVKDYGDHYGSSHKQLYGMSWLYIFVGTLPWSFYLLVPDNWKNRDFIRSVFRRDNDAERFLLCWIIGPPLFFTFSRNLLPAYILPAVPVFGILAGRVFGAMPLLCPNNLLARINKVVSALLFVIVVSLFIFGFNYRVIHFPNPLDTSHLISLIFVGACGFLLMRLLTTSSALNTLFVALVCVCAYCSTIYSLSPYLGDNFSTIGLNREIGKVNTRNIAHLNFPSGIPYSIHMYSKIPVEAEFDELLSGEERGKELVILSSKKNSAKYYTPEIKEHYSSELVGAGPWKVFLN